jgi:murein DD-endopeptidase MepM/ murein hydrolase activator NlpD
MIASRLRILAVRLLPAWSAGHWLAVLVLGMTGVAAFGLAPAGIEEPVPVQRILRDLPYPVRVADDAAADAPVPEHYWREERIRRGDTLGSVLARLGVDDPEALAFVRLDPSARPLYRLRPGKALRVQTDADGRLVALRFVANNGDLMSIGRDGERFATSAAPAPIEVRLEVAAGEIRSSLFAAADAAALPDAVTTQLAGIFAGDIDFHHDLRRGDRFGVVYEMLYCEGEAVGPGRIVAAEFTNRGKTTHAFLWREGTDAEAYYTERGMPVRKAFLRSPMEFSRVTSGFANERLHPILNTWRAHKGVDFAAPAGTPVQATGAGTVEFAGAQAGYGNVVVLHHRGSFTTVYAHLSQFAPQVRRGGRVAQGEVIGYVGQTGWATGPHLHYEFRVGDEQRDPLTVALPGSEPLPAAERRAFFAQAEPLAVRLATARSLSGQWLAATE